ncbi:MAG TPA: beta-ketoacyl synthase N-terminal-like domain-containing protein [Herpetosiphonaceae bacterium]
MLTEHDRGDADIAVVGMAGRFPGANTIQALWDNLCRGVESIRFPDQQELEALGVDAAALRDPHYVKASAVMDGVELFDAAFFGYTPREAELMDPQHRLFLECAWAALEHAGYDPERYPGTVGVFGGGTTNTYLLYNLLSNRETLGAFDPMQIDVSNASDFVATRISYKLNLKGPSFTVQTACSTSLVAIHIACQSLLNEECDMALAGGVSVHVKHPEGYWYLDGGNVSPDGHCRPFDARGAGTIFGSGVAAVMLKRLDDALRDGDHIHAVVKGSALNNDGAVKVGFTAPSVEGQTQVITEALAVADIRADTIRYVETHGTATKLGDPIEIRALTKAFRTQTNARHFCAIGSVKSNLGHLASAAGVTSFIKTVLMLEHGLIPPSLHFEQPNPDIDFENSPFYVNTQLTDWPQTHTPRRAGVSSFGVGGTNAHVVLEAAPARQPSSASRSWQLLLLSAKTGSALEAMTADLARHIAAQPDLNLADAAYTLQVGRSVFGQRRIVVCSSPADAVHVMETHDRSRIFSGVSQMQDRPVVFMFPGMGDHYVDMALELYQSEPTFRSWVDRCAALLTPVLGRDIREVVYPQGTAPRASADAPAASGQIDLRALLRRSGWQTDHGAQPINETALAHPILFTIEYALAQLWITWGVRPQAMIGYSIGEYVAACVAGVFSLEDALTLVARRAQLIQGLPSGAMLAVLLPEAEVLPWLRADLALAAVNTPQACVVSGTSEAVAELEQTLLGQGIACQRVQTTHAFHSWMMAPIEEPLQTLLAQIRLRPPTIALFSTVTGNWMDAGEATDPAYWSRHMRHPVRFASGLQALLQQPDQVLLEMGPGQTLAAMAKQHPAHTAEHVVLASLRQPHHQQPDLAVLLGTLGKLWIAGVAIDWQGFYAGEQRRRVALPTYPFERQRYWIDAQTTPREEAAPTPAERTADIADWFYTTSWKRSRLPAPARQTDLAQGPAAPWLVFVDDTGLGRSLAQRLAELGQPVIQVRRGGQFARIDTDAYTIDLRQREDYSALLRDLAARSQMPYAVVHCASLIHAPPAAADAATFKETQDTGFRSLIFLAQALEEQGLAAPLRLWVISNYVHLVESTDATHPARATILSPCLVIPQEYPLITCRYVEMSPAQSALEQARQADHLLAEMQATTDDPIVAYRGNRRWVPTFEPVQLAADRAPTYPLREHGVYMITEGLVGVGWALAQLLVLTVGAKLLLIERADFPQPEHWSSWLTTHDAADEVSRKLARLQTLQASGAQVLVASADGTDLDAMQAAVALGLARFGDLHGVIHTTGSIGSSAFTPIQELGDTEAEHQIMRTMQQLSALVETLAARELDFCLLTSSLSSVLGGLGQAAHAAASLFMDALAEHQTQTTGTPWLSVDWDIWQPEGDAAAMPNAPLAQFMIEPHAGVEAARRLLTERPGSRVVVSTGDLASRIKQPPRAADALGGAGAGGLRAQHPRPQLSSPYVAPRTDLERTIMDTWQAVFGLEQIGIDDNFFELGGNSLIAIHTMTRLKKILQVEVPTAMLYQRPTIRFLAELLAQDEDEAARQMAERLAKRKADLGRRHQVVQRRR